MGLLDGLVGDDTEKDQFGQTQADRRDPIWSGLIRAGLLAVAGGGNLMPEQRANYLAQAGGALADIPKEMRDAASASAQQKLRGQQLAEGTRKIADRDRLRAMAQTPEFLEKVKQLDPAEQMLLKAAIENGDLAHATTILGNTGKIDMRERKLALDQAEHERKVQRDKDKGFGWQGTNPELQFLNALRKGKEDPEFAKSTEYAQAHNMLSQDRTIVINGQSVVIPKLRDIGDYPTPGAAPAPASPSTTQTPQPPPPVAGEVRKNPDGSETWVDPDKQEVLTERPGGRLAVHDMNGRLLRVEEPKAPDAHLVQELTKIQAAEAKIQNAGKSFIAAWTNPSSGDRWSALMGGPSNMMEAWTNLAALIKESAVFNLGVLNGGDKAFIEGAIQNPAAWMAQWKGDEKTAQRQVQRIFDILDAGKKVYEKRVNEPPSRRPKTAAAPAATAPPEYIMTPNGPVLK